MTHDVIIICQCRKMGFGDQVGELNNDFMISCIRMKDAASLALLLSGKTSYEISEDAFLINEEIRTSDGSPLPEGTCGSPLITSLTEAYGIARISINNPKSIPSINGFSDKTPIYIYHQGDQAEKL